MRATLYLWLDALHRGGQKIGCVIHGDCRGPDHWGRDWAQEGWDWIRQEAYPADWDKHGKAAGFLRNSTMVDVCDIVVAVWDGTSKGTQDTIRKARLAKKPTVILYF